MTTQVRYQDQKGPRGWPLVSRRSLQIDGWSYPRNAELPLDKLSPAAIETLLSSKSADWAPPTGTRAQPRQIQAAPAMKPRPKFVLVPGKTPLESYHLSHIKLVGECDNNVALAADIIMKEAPDLYRTASAEAGRAL